MVGMIEGGAGKVNGHNVDRGHFARPLRARMLPATLVGVIRRRGERLVRFITMLTRFPFRPYAVGQSFVPHNPVTPQTNEQPAGKR